MWTFLTKVVRAFIAQSSHIRSLGLELSPRILTQLVYYYLLIYLFDALASLCVSAGRLSFYLLAPGSSGFGRGRVQAGMFRAAMRGSRSGGRSLLLSAAAPAGAPRQRQRVTSLGRNDRDYQVTCCAGGLLSCRGTLSYRNVNSYTNRWYLAVLWPRSTEGGGRWCCCCCSC